MIVTLRTERVRTLDQVHAFVEGSEAVDFTFEAHYHHQLHESAMAA